MTEPVRIIFICYENICRSPMAEGIFNALLLGRGLHRFFSVSSAGTVSRQSGSPPDHRATAALHTLGIDISSCRSCGIDEIDLYGYDWIFVMDDENYEDILRYFSDFPRPRVHRMMEFVDGRAHEEIPDPYYGSAKDFERVTGDLVTASGMILRELSRHYPFLSEQWAGES